MIGKLTGRPAGTTTDGAILVEVGGVGYAVRTTMAMLESIRAKKSEVSLFIHTAVREDAIDLYGFSTLEELAFFKQLMGVKGVGPKTALGMHSVACVNTLKHSFARGDSSALTKVYGIGKKSAERIVVELRDKLAGEAGAGIASGATGEDVRLLRSIVGPKVGVKASGGIRTLDDALAMIEAGASRLGTSSTESILNELRGSMAVS